MAGRERPIFKQIKYWVDNYGSAGISDQKAVEVFIDCETTESIKMLQAELLSIARGNFEQDSLDKLVKAKRRVNHNTYQEWAKLMLLWIVGYKH